MNTEFWFVTTLGVLFVLCIAAVASLRSVTPQRDNVEEVLATGVQVYSTNILVKDKTYRIVRIGKKCFITEEH